MKHNEEFAYRATCSGQILMAGGCGEGFCCVKDLQIGFAASKVVIAIGGWIRLARVTIRPIYAVFQSHER